ncbi:PIG-L family deacetylase [Pseudemcibacter aquimaris]|uniref:PIG-L family deacetylase n=1 Tax=Pseudemcibacter aquimaris TaxID=2857064 RepID=UPI002012D290|nr:PIG-L family deacetylase [Pseudemcibacter aquimaris]MCC3861137.1 PIG-L family deacetylase [Pseudemcibacter aquimaris]WDU59954.1 PIG-L family deacetylase [Pseudemcibacter aquimaris]
MTEAQRRIAEQQRKSGINKLWDALTPLKHVGSFMNCGAHPDDERSHILAYLARNQGVRVMYSTSTRGKGGQNAIGTEAGDDLGVFRSEEMEAAASEIPMSVHYYSARFGDEIDDFGFSTDPSEAENKWGIERTRERLVRIIREQRPDILSPTFLDTDGQHGHHRAITRATLDAYEMAADPNAFPEHMEQGLKPWKVLKLYLSAASGRGTVYDDRDPPPEPTVSIPTGMYDPINGATYRQIGEWSRARHLTQGMGRWREAKPEISHLHRLKCRFDIPLQEESVFDGLWQTLADMAKMTDGKLASDLNIAARLINDTITSFPNRDAIYNSLTDLAKKLNDIEAEIDNRSEEIKHNFAHRIKLKQKQVGIALYEASGLEVELIWDSNFTSPNQDFTGKVSIYNTGGQSWDNLSLSLIGTDGISELPINMQSFRIEPCEYKEVTIRLRIPENAEYHMPLEKDYEPFWDKEKFSCVLGLDDLGSKTILPANPVLVVPPVNLSWEASGLFYNRLTDGEPISAMLTVEKFTDIASDVEIGLDAPDGWTVTPPNYTVKAGTLPGSSKYNFTITGPTGGGRLEMTPYAICDGKRVEENVLMMDYAHIRNTCKVVPNTLAVQPIDLEIPKRLKVGYVDRGSDRVYFWLQRFGLDVSMLSVDDLKVQDLSVYDTIVIGIRAFAADLTATSPYLREYVENGGNLVTQYNRTDDDWNNETTPPRPITIGTPSFRWRITDPNAVVTHLKPDHHLLNAPHKIGEADWANWHQERGLYFPMEASPEYEFLLSMSDHGKTPLEGALISASIGDGWHHHCSLILHHQLEHQVPGAARLLANLITPPDWK